MRSIRIAPKKLLLPTAMTLMALFVLAGVLFHLKNQPFATWEDAFSALLISSGIITLLIALVTCPLLIARTVYFLFRLMAYGRKEDVSLFSAKLLFNPLNLLLFKSLLNDEGVHSRRRVLVSMVLFILLLLVMQLSTAMLKGLYS